MIFWFRPCNRRVRWRKHRFPSALGKICICIVGLAAIIGLLFVSPQWVLVLIIMILSVLVCALIKH